MKIYIILTDREIRIKCNKNDCALKNFYENNMKMYILDFYN